MTPPTAQEQVALSPMLVPYDLWLDIRDVVLKAPCRHVDESTSLACDDCVRVRRAVQAML